MAELPYEVRVRVTLNMDGPPEAVLAKTTAIMIHTPHPGVMRCWREKEKYSLTGMQMFVMGLAAGFNSAKEYVESHNLGTGPELLEIFLQELHNLSKATITSAQMRSEPKNPPPSDN